MDLQALLRYTGPLREAEIQPQIERAMKHAIPSPAPVAWRFTIERDPVTGDVVGIIAEPIPLGAEVPL